jgi:predicted Zn-dependent protease
MRQFAVTSRPGAAWKVPSRALAGALALAVALPFPAALADERVSVVRDAETEALIADYLGPIVKAAGIQRPTLLLIPSQTFNAFVTTEHRLFVNVGTVIASDTPNELIGVLAHEMGHVAHNDVANMVQAMNDTRAALLLAGIVGIGAAAAAAAAGNAGAAQAGAGIVSGSTSIAERSLLSFKRDQEAAADRSAMAFLGKTNQSAAGMLAVLKRLANENLLSARRADPYLQSHPLPAARVNAIEALVAASPYTSRKDPPELQLRHDLVRAKLVGFTLPATQVMRRYTISDNSLPARYARTIAAYRSANTAAALKQVDELLQASPNDPYFWELRGQMLLETGKPQAAIEPLRKAVSLAPSAGLIKVLLGQALVANGGKAGAEEAVKLLAAAVQAYPDLPGSYHALARAYALQGNIPMAQLATAQGLFVDGNIQDAQIQASKAQAKLKAGTPAWLRADDIVSYKPPKSK